MVGRPEESLRLRAGEHWSTGWTARHAGNCVQEKTLIRPEIQKHMNKNTTTLVVSRTLGKLRLVTIKHKRKEPLNYAGCIWQRSGVLTRLLWVEWLQDECQVRLVTETQLRQPRPLLHTHCQGEQQKNPPNTKSQDIKNKHHHDNRRIPNPSSQKFQFHLFIQSKM